MSRRPYRKPTDAARRDAEMIKQARLEAKLAGLQARGKSVRRMYREDGVSHRDAPARLHETSRRVAAMDEADRAAATSVPPPAAEGTPRHRALELRERGLPLRAIAEQLGTSHDTVRRWIAEELERLDGRTIRVTDRHLTLELLRTERLIASLWPAAMAGGTEACAKIIRVIGHQAKLLGFDAPSKFDATASIVRIAEEYGIDPAELEAEFLAMGEQAPDPADARRN